MTSCMFCDPPKPETVLWRDAAARVIDVADADYPGYCRVVWNAHVTEMSDLATADRAHVMRIAYAVEESLRALLRPDKVNLASLGNLVPHLHWHVIPRFADDPHFPDPVWGARRREARARPLEREALARAIGARLAAP